MDQGPSKFETSYVYAHKPQSTSATVALFVLLLFVVGGAGYFGFMEYRSLRGDHQRALLKLHSAESEIEKLTEFNQSLRNQLNHKQGPTPAAATAMTVATNAVPNEGGAAERPLANVSSGGPVPAAESSAAALPSSAAPGVQAPPAPAKSDRDIYARAHGLIVSQGHFDEGLSLISDFEQQFPDSSLRSHVEKLRAFGLSKKSLKDKGP